MSRRGNKFHLLEGVVPTCIISKSFVGKEDLSFPLVYLFIQSLNYIPEFMNIYFILSVIIYGVQAAQELGYHRLSQQP